MSIGKPPRPNSGEPYAEEPEFGKEALGRLCFLFRLPRIGAGGLILLVRLAALDADPPPWLSWSTGLYTDEGYYTLDARHEALFGTLAPGNFHDRLLSPLLSLLQQGIFEIFGVGLLQARLLCVSFGLLTIAAFWLALRRAYDVRTADYGALFLGLAPPFALYNRLALQETPTVFWLVLAFALWAYGIKWASGAALAFAVVFKGLAIVALPALWIPTQAQAPTLPKREGEEFAARRASLSSLTGRTPAKQGGGFLLALALYFAFWYWPHHAELSRMAAYYRVHQIAPHSAVSVWLNLRRGLIGGERGVLPYLLALMPVPCLLAGWGTIKWRQWTPADRYLAVWLACGLLFCLLSSYAPSRYYVLFLPPLLGLAARIGANLKRPAQIAAAALFLMTSGLWYGAAWAGLTYSERDAGQAMSRLLPPGSVVVGEFAPALCLDTRLISAPVQPGLSNDDRPVERLHAAAVVVTRTPFWEAWWTARYPGIMQPSHKLATFTLGGPRRYVEDVYAVQAAGR